MQTIETALALSVQRFDKGSTALLDMLVQLELMTGPSMEEYVEKEDSNRVVEATRKTSTKDKEKNRPCEAARTSAKTKPRSGV